MPNARQQTLSELIDRCEQAGAGGELRCELNRINNSKARSNKKADEKRRLRLRALRFLNGEMDTLATVQACSRRMSCVAEQASMPSSLQLPVVPLA